MKLRYWFRLWQLHHKSKSLVMFSIDKTDYHLSWSDAETALPLTSVCTDLLRQELGGQNAYREAVKIVRLSDAGQN